MRHGVYLVRHGDLWPPTGLLAAQPLFYYLFFMKTKKIVTLNCKLEGFFQTFHKPSEASNRCWNNLAFFILDTGACQIPNPSMLLELFAKSNFWKDPPLCQFSWLFPFTLYQYWNSGLELQQSLVRSALWTCVQQLDISSGLQTASWSAAATFQLVLCKCARIFLDWAVTDVSAEPSVLLPLLRWYLSITTHTGAKHFHKFCLS